MCQKKSKSNRRPRSLSLRSRRGARQLHPKDMVELISSKHKPESKKPVCFGVLAKGGIKSDTEFELLEEYLSKHRSPKALIVVHGQNDIINKTFNLESESPGAREDYSRVGAEATDQLLIYSGAIRELALKNKIYTYEVIPPSALDKIPLTPSEKAILVGYAGPKLYDWSLPRRLLNHHFDKAALSLKVSDLLNQDYTFIDLRDTFNSTTTTLFSDIWHFGDRGHEIISEHVAAALNSQFQQPSGIRDHLNSLDTEDLY